MWSRNGNLNKMEQDRVGKAQKASFVIRKAINTSHNVSVNLALSLLDKQIQPILLYGCPIWGFPSSNCSIRFKYDNFNTKHLKKQMYTFLESLNISNIEIVSCHYVKSSDDVVITLKNIMDKIEIFKNLKLCSVTFTVTDNTRHTYGLTEKFYNKYCKYTLGISKYSSNTLTLGELGR